MRLKKHSEETRPAPVARRKVPVAADLLRDDMEAERRRRLYEAILSSTADLVYSFDLNGRFTYANEALLRMWGVTLEDAIGKSCLEVGYERWHAEIHERDIDRVVATKQPVRGEVPFNGKHGRGLFDYIFVPVIGENGEVEAIAGTSRDITDRKESDGILERYRLMSEKSRDVIWFLNQDQNFVEVNSAAIDMYGYAREEFMTMNIADVRHPSTLPDLMEHFDSAVPAGVHFETIHVRKDGTSFPVDVIANAANFGDEWLVMSIVRDISDRQTADEALRESEERGRLAQQAGRIGIWDWDIIADKTYWSETMWSLYGETPGEKNPDETFWSEHLHPSDRERVINYFFQVVHSDENRYHDEFRVIRDDGSVRWIEAIATVVRSETGNATRMYGVNIDVTEHKKSEMMVKLSENQLRLVTNAVPALISYVDSSERYRFVNQQFTEWFGTPANKLVGKTVREVIGVNAYREIKPYIDNALSGQECTFENILNYKKVGKRYVNISYVPDIGVDGTVYGFYGLTNDLTDLKRSQDLLRSSEERMSLMMENLTDYAIFSVDVEGRIDSWNSGAELIFGYPQDEILGKPYEILFSAEDVDRGVSLKEMRTARQKGRAAVERWHLRKDGSRFFANGVMMPLRVGDVLSGYAKIASDLTEKQRRAEELQRAHHELEVRVKERTRELAESNLALIQEMEVREVAERERIELLGRLVTSQEFERRRIARDLHDQLGQRLTALRLKIASLKEITAGDEVVNGRVIRLQDIAEKLDSEVSFLAWELRPTALDDLGLVDAVGAFVDEWSRHYETPADFHSSGLSKGRLSHDTETHLYRIAQEALNNITKHAVAKHVTVLLEKRDDDVILIVEDDGSGFDPGQVRVSSESGKGLGLIGMSERASLIGGNVQIESARGKGTTIYVRVPLKA